MTRERRLRMIAQDMQLFKALPDDYQEFAETAAMKNHNYLFYSKKDNICFCSGCRFDVKMPEYIRHNKITTCPLCGRYEVAKSLGYSRNNIKDVEWSVMCEPADDGYMLFRYVQHVKSYKDYRHPIVRTYEKFREVVKPFGKDIVYGLYSDGWAHYRRPYNSYYISEWSEPVSGAYLYNLNINEDLKETKYYNRGLDKVVKEYHKQDLEDDLFADKHIKLKRAYCLSDYIDLINREPWIELFCKLDMLQFAYSLNDFHRSELNKAATTPYEILKITKNNFKLLRQSKTGVSGYRILQKAEQHNINLNEKELCTLRYHFEYHSDEVFELMKYMSFYKATTWLKKDSLYADYIDMCANLGYDMKSKSVKFPPDIKKAHEIITKEFNSQLKKRLRKNMQLAIKSGTYDFEYKGLKIVVPRTSKDIIQEGQRLHHCVGRYVDDVAKGKTMILFIRKTSSQDVPFYTLEWKDNRIKQCYGLKDCAATEAVKEFEEKFTEYMLCG